MARVLRQVGIFVFLTSLSSAHAFSTGSLLISSCAISALHFQCKEPESHPAQPLWLACVVNTHGHRHQEACSLDLPHMRDSASFMSLELLNRLPALPNDADESIARPKKQAVGARANARYLVVLKKLPSFLVRQRHRGDIEEVERLPLGTWSVTGRGTRPIAGSTTYRDGHPVASERRRWTLKVKVKALSARAMTMAGRLELGGSELYHKGPLI